MIRKCLKTIKSDWLMYMFLLLIVIAFIIAAVWSDAFSRL